MPVSAKDLLGGGDGDLLLRLLVLGWSRVGKTTTILKSCPKPALVIFADHDPQRLRGAYEFTKDFEVEEATSYNSAVAACKLAHEGARSGKYKTVLLDTLSSLSTAIENECEAEDKRQNSSGKANGMKYFFVYRKRLAHIVRNLVDLPCHFVAASHYGEEGNSDAIQEAGEGTRKRGKRLVPLLAGQARGEIPREFRDIVWLDIRGGERVFQCGPDHEYYGPACNTIQDLEVPADITQLIKLFREGSPIPDTNGVSPKIPVRLAPKQPQYARPQQQQRQPIRK